MLRELIVPQGGWHDGKTPWKAAVLMMPGAPMKAPLAKPAGGLLFCGRKKAGVPNLGDNAANRAFYPIKVIWITA